MLAMLPLIRSRISLECCSTAVILKLQTLANPLMHKPCYSSTEGVSVTDIAFRTNSNPFTKMAHSKHCLCTCVARGQRGLWSEPNDYSQYSLSVAAPFLLLLLHSASVDTICLSCIYCAIYKWTHNGCAKAWHLFHPSILKCRRMYSGGPFRYPLQGCSQFPRCY